ncbi:MAG: deoxyribonuclease IV [Candidatus Bathyarchaeota archaeon]|nr:deoxyribonuclease IV [Candidatus Bathyarchaeota archaeon]
MIPVKIGFHVSIKETIDRAVDQAVEGNYTTFQIFTRNPRQWKPKELNLEVARVFIEKVKTNDLNPIFAHMPYLPNLASPKREVYTKSCSTLRTELKRCSQLEIPYLVTHLGSHLGTGLQTGLKRITSAVNKALKAESGKVVLLLENTAGTRNSVGSSFEVIQRILRGLLYPEFVGICLDTSHAFAAGYDLRTRKNVEEIIRKVDDTVGFEKLKLIHLNDSKGGLSSHIDRHEHVGLGRIGEDGFRNILRSRLGQLPLILETPRDSRRSDVGNLRKVRELAQKA